MQNGAVKIYIKSCYHFDKNALVALCVTRAKKKVHALAYKVLYNLTFSTFFPCYLSELIIYYCLPCLLHYNHTGLPSISEAGQEWFCFRVFILAIPIGLYSNVTVSLKPSLDILYKIVAPLNITYSYPSFLPHFFLAFITTYLLIYLLII